MDDAVEPPATRRIVVGVDGSRTSREALRWAAAEAAARQAELHVVHAWDVPSLGAGIGITQRRVSASAPEAQRREAERLVTDLVVDELGPAGRDIRPSIGQGSPARVLLEAARGADLLVVGSRGAGGFAGLLLGSVSTTMASHAPCTVVIVRPAAPEDH